MVSWLRFCSSAMSGSYKTLLNVWSFLNCFACINIVKGCQCQSTSLLFAENIPRLKRSMNEASSKMSPTRCSTTPNIMRVHKLPVQRCVKITLSSGSGPSMAVRSVGKLLHFSRRVQYLGSVEKQINFKPALVSKRQLVVFIIVDAALFEILNFYISLAVKLMAASSIGIGSGSDSNIAASGGHAKRDSVVDRTNGKKRDLLLCSVFGLWGLFFWRLVLLFWV